MGVGYSLSKESALTQFLAISLEKFFSSPPDILSVLEPNLKKRNGQEEKVPVEFEASGQPRDSNSPSADLVSAGLVHRIVRKQWPGGISRVLKRGPQLVIHMGGNSPFSSSPSLGSPTATELAETRDFLCRLIALLEGDYRLEASPYYGKMFTRNILIFSSVNASTCQKDGSEARNMCLYREYAVDPTECVVWIGIRSKSVLQLSQSLALGHCSSTGHCCHQSMTSGSEDEAALLKWIRAEFSGAKLVHYPKGSATELPACPGHGQLRFTEVHFQGTPFASQKFDEMITTRRLFLGLFRHLQARNFAFCAQLSVRGNSKNDTLFFKKTAEVNRLDAPLAASVPQQKQLFLLSFESKCHLRLFECPPEAAKSVEQSFADHRVKQIRPSWMGCSEICFGLPLFWADQNQLLETQLTVLDMLSALWRIGWKFAGATQIGQSPNDKASIVFEATDDRLAAPSKLMGLSTARSDQLRLLDAPAKVAALARAIVEAEWEKGVQEELPAPSDRAVVLKMRGRPWSCRDNSLEAASAQHLLVFLCERFHRLGWRLLCSLDVGAKVNDDDDAHLYCEDGELLVFWHQDGGESEQPIEEEEEGVKQQEKEEEDEKELAEAPAPMASAPGNGGVGFGPAGENE